MGSGMRRIRTSRVEVDWLQGPGPCDLWIWHSPGGELSHVELAFSGRLARLTGETLATGRSQAAVGSSYAQTELVELDPTLDPLTLLGATRLVEAIPTDLKSAPVSALEKALLAASTPNI